MLKKKCPSCAEKIERKFSYCPYCGASIKVKEDSRDFGMIGRNDFGQMTNELRLPPGFGKIVNSLMKQLEKQMKNMDLENDKGRPRGFRMTISSGNSQPNQANQIIRREGEKRHVRKISREEFERRMKLPKEEADSKVKRLSDRIVYEINTPGVKSREGVSITGLASGIEVRAYSDDKCYIKFIPVSSELIGYGVEDGKVFVELKG